MPKPTDPCKKIACKIQKCLHEHNYQPAPCADVFEEMNECCRKWGQASLCCSGIKVEEKTSNPA